MVHKDPKLDHMINEVKDDWEEVKHEVETKLKLGRLEMDHLKLIDTVEESMIHITNRSPNSKDQLKTVCDEAESLRSKVRRKLMRERTTEIPYPCIVS